MTWGRVLPGWAVAVACLLAAAVITAVALMTGGGTESRTHASPPPPTAVVADINGLQIPVRELALYLAQERAATFAHFQQTYGVGDGPRFWTTPHGGQTPADYLKRRALTDVTQATVVLGLAHQHRLIPYQDYGAFVAAWTQENARRLRAAAAHQVVYGPVQYTEANYFSYLLHDLDARLEQELGKTGTIPTSGSALRAYYRTHINTFRRQDPRSKSMVTPPFDQIVSQVRQAYVHDSYQALTSKLSRSARIHVRHAVFDAVPVS